MPGGKISSRALAVVGDGIRPPGSYTGPNSSTQYTVIQCCSIHMLLWTGLQ